LSFDLGITLLALVIVSAYKKITLETSTEKSQISEKNIFLMFWITGTVVFIIQFAPFMAIRHVLLILPPVLLLLNNFIEINNINSTMKITALIITATLGLTISIADYYYADLNREYATKIKSMLPADARIWQVGHWGWQWYSRKAGMLQYDDGISKIQAGDYLVIPKFITQDRVYEPANLKMQQLTEVDAPTSYPLMLRTQSLYIFGYPEAFPINIQEQDFVFLIQKVVRQ
jgi:hypothetical protein